MAAASTFEFDAGYRFVLGAARFSLSQVLFLLLIVSFQEGDDGALHAQKPSFAES